MDVSSSSGLTDATKMERMGAVIACSGPPAVKTEEAVDLASKLLLGDAPSSGTIATKADGKDTEINPSGQPEEDSGIDEDEEPVASIDDAPSSRMTGAKATECDETRTSSGLPAENREEDEDVEDDELVKAASPTSTVTSSSRMIGSKAKARDAELWEGSEDDNDKVLVDS